MAARMAKLSALIALAVVCTATASSPSPINPSSRTRHPRTGAPLRIPGRDGQATVLHNGWRITPAGRSIATGDMLLGGAISPDGRTLAVVNSGYRAHALHLVDLKTEKEYARVPIGRSWGGLAWAPDGRRIYVAGGVSNPIGDVLVFRQNAVGQWVAGKALRLTTYGGGRARVIAGLALAPDGMTLFVTNNQDGRLYVLDAPTGITRASVAVGDHPGVCRLSRDGQRAFVALWGGSSVAVVDVTHADTPVVEGKIATGSHPNDIALGVDGRIYVSCGNSDCVTIADTANLQTLETVRTALTPRSPGGCTPDAVAMSPDGRTLFVPNADVNYATVIDVSVPRKSRVLGFIPTGWYPTAAFVAPDGKRVILCSGKGLGTGPNPARKPIPREYVGGFAHIGMQLGGLISFVDIPDRAGLDAYTRRVIANTPYRDRLLGQSSWQLTTAIPTRVGLPSPIKYVLYIIKENRTYDQVFGDLPRGNGDPDLTLFGREVTPNQHALAEQFVLLDNLYCNGEVSADGHPWSTAAYATDFVQRSWVLEYSLKGATSGSDSVNDPRTGYIWQACARKGLTYRTYGEYWNHPSLRGHTNERFVGKVRPGEAPPGRDTERADIFIAEFKEFERKGKIPRFMIMSLGENHTNGTMPGAYTPRAMVASNDLAVGRIVDAISHSSVWKQFAIFVIEDDAQNGPDHVDAHRTCGLVISPWVRRKIVDSTFYTTTSMLRTMELILGLPPLTEHDAAATPMFACFTNQPNLTPYEALPARIDLDEKNGATAYGASLSARMDWSRYDNIDEDALNRILWHSIKGPHTPMPAPVHGAILTGRGKLAIAANEGDSDD